MGWAGGHGREISRGPPSEAGVGAATRRKSERILVVSSLRGVELNESGRGKFRCNLGHRSKKCQNSDRDAEG